MKNKDHLDWNNWLYRLEILLTSMYINLVLFIVLIAFFFTQESFLGVIILSVMILVHVIIIILIIALKNKSSFYDFKIFKGTVQTTETILTDFLDKNKIEYHKSINQRKNMTNINTVIDIKDYEIWLKNRANNTALAVVSSKPDLNEHLLRLRTINNLLNPQPL